MASPTTMPKVSNQMLGIEGAGTSVEGGQFFAALGDQVANLIVAVQTVQRLVTVAGKPQRNAGLPRCGHRNGSPLFQHEPASKGQIPALGRVGHWGLGDVDHAGQHPNLVGSNAGALHQPVGAEGCGRDEAVHVPCEQACLACHGVAQGKGSTLGQAGAAVLTHAGPLTFIGAAQTHLPAMKMVVGWASKAVVVHAHHHRNAPPAALWKHPGRDQRVELMHVHQRRALGVKLVGERLDGAACVQAIDKCADLGAQAIPKAAAVTHELVDCPAGLTQHGNGGMGGVVSAAAAPVQVVGVENAALRSHGRGGSRTSGLMARAGCGRHQAGGSYGSGIVAERQTAATIAAGNPSRIATGLKPT